MKSFSLGAGILGFLGVALGAFGAHGLREILAERNSLETWHTAVLYQLLHAGALLAISFAADHTKWLVFAGRFWIAGTTLFSGSLYLLALGGPASLLGPVTPLGGLAYLAGWTCIFVHALRRNPAD